MKSAVFFERDAVLNHVKVIGNQQLTPRTVQELEPNPDALEPLQTLKNAGFLLIATSNQPGLSSGLQNRRDLDRMHEVLMRTFPLDAVMVCPHNPSDHCPCHKPRPGLLQEAGFKWQLDLERSYVVSDKWQDAKIAQLVGATSILLRSRWNGSVHHDFIVDNIRDIAARIQSIHAASILAMDQV